MTEERASRAGLCPGMKKADTRCRRRIRRQTDHQYRKKVAGFTPFRQPHSSMLTVRADISSAQDDLGPTLQSCHARADVSPEPRSSLGRQSRCNPAVDRPILKLLGDIAHASRPAPIELATKKANREVDLGRSEPPWAILSRRWEMGANSGVSIPHIFNVLGEDSGASRSSWNEKRSAGG